MQDHPLKLNIGCGFQKFKGFLNTDKYAICKPDLLLDLNETPWPFGDESFFEIRAYHVFEHLLLWWDAFVECSRILKTNGLLDMRVPDYSSDRGLTYRDHLHVFSHHSFHGIKNYGTGTSAWAKTQTETVPFKLVEYIRVPHEQYRWMRFFPSIFDFCANHLRNFVHEQIFIFQKIDPDREV